MFPPKLKPGDGVRVIAPSCSLSSITWLTDDFLAKAAGRFESLGLRVPEDVAIVGVENDTAICTLSRPTLTSVSRRSRLVGRAAAELLNKLMAGAPMSRRSPGLQTMDGLKSFRCLTQHLCCMHNISVIFSLP